MNNELHNTNSMAPVSAWNSPSTPHAPPTGANNNANLESGPGTGSGMVTQNHEKSTNGVNISAYSRIFIVILIIIYAVVLTLLADTVYCALSLANQSVVFGFQLAMARSLKWWIFGVSVAFSVLFLLYSIFKFSKSYRGVDNGGTRSVMARMTLFLSSIILLANVICSALYIVFYLYFTAYTYTIFIILLVTLICTGLIVIMFAMVAKHQASFILSERNDAVADFVAPPPSPLRPQDDNRYHRGQASESESQNRNSGSGGSARLPEMNGSAAAAASDLPWRSSSHGQNETEIEVESEPESESSDVQGVESDAIATDQCPFFCPICMLFYSTVRNVTCCNNHICGGCAVGYSAGKFGLSASMTRLPHTLPSELTCPYCNTPGFDPISLKLGENDKPRTYEDSPHVSQVLARRVLLHSPLKAGASFSEMRRKMGGFDMDHGISLPNVLATPLGPSGSAITPFADDHDHEGLEDGDGEVIEIPAPSIGQVQTQAQAAPPLQRSRSPYLPSEVRRHREMLYASVVIDDDRNREEEGGEGEGEASLGLNSTDDSASIRSGNPMGSLRGVSLSIDIPQDADQAEIERLKTATASSQAQAEAF